MMTFFLDGNQVDNPKGWTNLSSVIKRDTELDGLLLFQDGVLDFEGDGYDYIVSKLTGDGYCSFIEVEVTQECNGINALLLSGKIILSDVIIDEQGCSVNCKIQDNSFFTLINNNKNIKTISNVPLSKNGQAITAAALYNLRVYDSQNVFNRSAYAIRVYEAFRYLIAFMTDGRVGFVSDTFNEGGEWEGLVITDGLHMSSTNTSVYAYAPLEAFSFSELYQEIKRRIPIGFTIENPYTSPVMRIEAMEYFFDTSSTVSFDHINSIKTRFEKTKIYSGIDVGTTITNSSSFLPFPENIELLGVNQEEYFLTGVFNMDTKLNLVCDWVTSTNVIVNCVEESDQSNDSALFLMDTAAEGGFEADWPLTRGRTRQSNYLGINPVPDPRVYFYNERLRNRNVLERYRNYLNGSAIKYLGTPGDGLFEAIFTAPVVSSAITINPVPFDGELSDPGNDYDTGTYTFTCPLTGYFIFSLRLHISTLRTLVNIYAERYDSSNTLVSDQLVISRAASSGNTTTDEFSMVLNVGDYVQIKMYMPGSGSFTLQANDSFWRCTANTINGGEYIIGNPDSYPITIHEFAYPLSDTQFSTIVTEMMKSFPFYADSGLIRQGWLSELNYNHHTQQATVKMIADKNAQHGN